MRFTTMPTDDFVGRAGPQAVLGSRLATAVNERRGGLIIVEGEAGIGKTALVRKVLMSAVAGAGVVWARCREVGGPAFALWASVLEGLSGATGPPLAARTLSATECWALSVVAPDTADRWWPGMTRAVSFDNSDVERTEVVVSAARAIARLVAGALVVVFDDVQWADVPSLLLLAQLCPAIESLPLAIVLTARPAEVSDAGAAVLGELRRQATIVSLGGLVASEVQALLASAGLPVDEEGTLAAAVVERTGGNAFFISELIRSIQLAHPQGGTDDLRGAVQGEVPREVTQLVRRRLARLPAAVAELVETAAVLGLDGDVGALAAVAGTDSADVLDLLAPAVDVRGLIDHDGRRWRFVHDLLRDAILTGVAAKRRRELNRRALVAFQLRAAPAAVRARHALAARPTVDDATVTTLVRQAAEEARVALDFEGAARWYETALAEIPSVSDVDRADLLLAAGTARRRAGDPSAARPAFRTAYELAADDPERLGVAALGYADPGADLGLAYDVSDPSTARFLDAALDAQPAGDRELTVRLQVRLAAELYFGTEPERSRLLLEDAVATASRIGDPAVLVAAEAVHHDGFVVGTPDPWVALASSANIAALARASGDRTARLTAHRARVIDLLTAGDIGAVDAEIAAFGRLAGDVGDLGLRWWPLLWRAMRALLDGRLDEADELADEALAVGSRAFGHGAFGGLAFANYSFHLFFSFRERGRLLELESIARAYVASQAHVPGIGCSLVLLLAETDRLDEASGLLSATIAGGYERLHDRNWPVSWFQLARTAFLVREADVARSLLGTGGPVPGSCVQVSVGTVCLGAADVAHGWLYATAGERDAAESAYRRAIVVNSRVGARCWLAQARNDLASLLVEGGHLEEARSLLIVVLEAARTIGLADLQRRATATWTDLETIGRATGSKVAANPYDSIHGTFRRTGSSWQLSFAGRTVHMVNAKGLADLAVLLVRPGEAVTAVELVGLQADGLAPSGGGIELLDRRARDELRQRLSELEVDLDEADAQNDLGRSERLSAERDALVDALAAAVGLGGRARRIDDPSERARKAVTARIRNSILRIQAVHPDLGRHLSRSVNTGTWCRYDPEAPATWEL